VTDIEKVATITKRFNASALLAVDNTFCSPYFQNPLEHGADVVVHSVTKYIGGHSDVVMGAVCTNDAEVYEQLRFFQNGMGAVPSPFDCYLAHRGLKTLHVRMEAAARNAHAIALFLEDHEGATKVVYPGLKSHPQHDIASRQQNGYGAMITFYCVGGRAQSGIVLKNLRVFALAESLGAVESLAECPSLMTHASVPDDQRALLGIDDTLIRLSVGIESCADLVADLDGALNAAVKSTKQTSFLPGAAVDDGGEDGGGYWDW
jgi:cystathionine gamma-lyase